MTNVISGDDITMNYSENYNLTTAGIYNATATVYDASGKDFPGLEVEIVNEFTVGDQAALEWHATLTNTKGEKFEIDGVNIIKIRDGKFQWVHAYFDPTVLNQ